MRYYVILVLLLAGFTAAVAGSIWNNNQAAEIIGPDHFTINEDTVLIHFNRHLYRLNGQGDTLGKWHLNDFGFAGKDSVEPPVDLQFIDKNTFLIGISNNKGLIQRCDFENRSCVKLNIDATLSDVFRFFYHKDTQRLFIADSSNHRIVLHDLKKQATQEITSPGLNLTYPNKIVFTDDGSVMVADTDGHRILKIKLTQLNVVAGVAESAHTGSQFPVSFAEFGAQWWLAVTRDLHRDGELWVFDKNWQMQRIVHTPGESNILLVSSRDDNLLVSDSDRTAVYQWNIENKQWRRFGRGAFREDLAKWGAKRRHLMQMSGLLLYSLAPIMVGMFFVAGVIEFARLQSRLKRPLGTLRRQKLGEIPGVQWFSVSDEQKHLILEERSKNAKKMKWTVVLLFISSAFLLTPFFFKPEKWEKATDELFLVMVSIRVLPLIGLVISIIAHKKSNETKFDKIGTDGDKVYLLKSGGWGVSADFEQLLASNRCLALGGEVFPLVDMKYKPLVMNEGFHNEIKSRIKPSNRIAEAQMTIYQIALMEPWKVGVILIAMLLGLWALLYYVQYNVM